MIKCFLIRRIDDQSVAMIYNFERFIDVSQRLYELFGNVYRFGVSFDDGCVVDYCINNIYNFDDVMSLIRSHYEEDFNNHV